MTGDSGSDRSVVTRVIAYDVRLGQDQAFQAWQKSIEDAALKFPGALRIDVLPSDQKASSREWVVVYRFQGEAALQAWLSSPERARGLASAPDIFVAKPTEYTLAGAEGSERGETIITSNEVIPGKEAEYEAADRALNEAATRFPGFLGTKVFKPQPGSRTWSTMVRFDNKADMDRWLASPERASGREKMYRFALSHHANVVPTGFGSWFAVNAADGIQAPAWKQAMTVLAALFPTVMLLNITVAKLMASQGTPFALNVFVGNALGTIALTWLLMPVVTRLMAWWLSPRCPPDKMWLGAALLIGVYAAEIALFVSRPLTLVE
jgi:antibiotic biosynthesis monooxygenase (ABM) superfamily enzyme